MSELKKIYDSLLLTGDLPRAYSGDWSTDKKKFTSDYSSNHLIIEEDGDDFYELDDPY